MKSLLNELILEAFYAVIVASDVTVNNTFLHVTPIDSLTVHNHEQTE